MSIENLHYDYTCIIFHFSALPITKFRVINFIYLSEYLS